MHALAHVRRLLPTYVGRGSLWSFYCQKQIFAYLKSYIFHFNTPQVNLIFGWSLIGMAMGRVRAGLFNTRTQLAGLAQKPGPSLFIKRIFFLTPNLAHQVPVGPPTMPQFGPNPKINNKNLPEACTVAQSLKKNASLDSLFLKMCLLDSFYF